MATTAVGAITRPKPPASLVPPPLSFMAAPVIDLEARPVTPTPCDDEDGVVSKETQPMDWRGRKMFGDGFVVGFQSLSPVPTPSPMPSSDDEDA